MESYLSDESGFVKLLLETDYAQQIALLRTITDNQVKALCEIAYNLPKLSDLGSHQQFISYLGDQKHTTRYKKSIIKKHATRLLRALVAVKDKLLELLK